MEKKLKGENKKEGGDIVGQPPADVFLAVGPVIVEGRTWKREGKAGVKDR